MGIPPTSAMFSKGDNFSDFLLANLEDEAFKRGLFMKETICSRGSNFFSLRVDPEMGGTNENKSCFP